MIIWINGAFGSGKTQTSYELHRRVPHSFVYDPENIGSFIKKNIPKEAYMDDFQNYTIWRDCNYSILKYIDSEYDGIIFVPMTIVNPQYYNEMIGKLKNDGIIVNHFVLWASKQTLKRRLHSRGERKNSWGVKQIDRCIEGLSHDVFQHRIDTENMTIEAVAEKIAFMSNIDLLPNNSSKLRKKLNRIKTQLKQVLF